MARLCTADATCGDWGDVHCDCYYHGGICCECGAFTDLFDKEDYYYDDDNYDYDLEFDEEEETEE